MKLVIFGLSVSSAWGNGHATLWRGLLRALIERGHYPVFFERDVPYYAQNRDLWEIEGGELVLYTEWKNILPLAESHLREADIGMITSYCPDAVAATEAVMNSGVPYRVFYDLDTPVTLERAMAGDCVEYLGPRALRDFDLVFSYTGGQALTETQRLFGACEVVPLYGSADPREHRPAAPSPEYEADLSYLGTYAADRQRKLEDLFVEPARRLPEQRFLLGGSQYPDAFPWTGNMRYAGHVPPPAHPQFYCSAKLNLSVTRQAMANMGWCPSGRLFEAAACGAPLLTDYWPGLEEFFEPGREILVAETTEEAIEHLQRPAAELRSIGQAALERVREQHTAAHRAEEFEAAIEEIGEYREVA